jgi:uncharacterized protein (DUF2384 family)
MPYSTLAWDFAGVESNPLAKPPLSRHNDTDMTARYDTTETAQLADAATWLDDLDEVQRELAVSPTLPEAAEKRLWHVLHEMPTSPTELQGMDPYLAQAFLGGAVESLKALHDDDARMQRRHLRVGVEQLRQALRDALSDEVASPDQPAGSLARWLVDVLRVSVGDLSGLVGVTPRTFHRWMEDDSIEPSSNDGARLATIAQIANQLRHVFTGPGVVGWFARPSADLDGETPGALLDDPVRYPEVLSAARRYRSMVAA